VSLHRQLTWKALVAIGADETKHQFTVSGAIDLPEQFIETLTAAVQGGGLLVLRQAIGAALQSEDSAADPVGVSAEYRPEGTPGEDVFRNIVEPENHMVDSARPVRDLERHDARSEIGDANSEAFILNPGVEGLR
jgi:hypothetical protein